MADDLKDKAAEMVRKILTVGVGAVFLTEESLRGMVSELKLPKEMLGGILESAGKSKNEFFQRLSTDVIERVRDKIDPRALVEEFLSRNDIEFHVRMSFKPKSRDKEKTPAKSDS